MKIMRFLFMIVPVLLGGTAVYAMEIAPCASGPIMTASAMDCCGVGCGCSMKAPVSPSNALAGGAQVQTAFFQDTAKDLSTVRSLDLPSTSDQDQTSAETEESPHLSSSVRLYDLISDYRK